MKRILAVLLIMCVAVTMFVACGEKTEEPATDTTTTTTETTTENKTETTTENTEKPADPAMPVEGAFDTPAFSVSLPDGWVGTNDEANSGATLAFTKDPTSFISMIYNIANTDPIEKIVEGMSAGAPVEDVTIGANTFKKFVVQGANATMIIAVKGSVGLIITVAKIDGADEQAILSSLNIK